MRAKEGKYIVHIYVFIHYNEWALGSSDGRQDVLRESKISECSEHNM